MRTQKPAVRSSQFGVLPHGVLPGGLPHGVPPSGGLQLRGKNRLKAELRTKEAVALVITLLMLSVITFMAIAFLAVSRRERSSVTGTLNQVDAQAMADAALARAQADMAAYLMAHNTNAAPRAGRPNDLLNYDLMMSHDFINPYGFNNAGGAIVATNLTNVSYVYPNGAPLNTDDQIQNIANLLYDPRVPVYIQTNVAFTNLDFRYWVDYNRNGKFESNGFLPALDTFGNPVVVNGVIQTNFFVGEPEWVGALREPDLPHGTAGNTFIGRWAYLILPIGKTLDVNFIHNYAKSNFPASPMTFDGYFRNQGYGPWELNLAGLLAGVNSNIWATDYVYAVQANGTPDGQNSSQGVAFKDALSFLKYRYNDNSHNLQSFASQFPQNTLGYFFNDRIDEYSDGPVATTAIDGNFVDSDPLTTQGWPGSTNYNSFYEPQDIFDKLQNIPPPTPANPNFYTRLTNALAQNDTTNRYTFSQLLASVGTDSNPELYCWVHADDGSLVKRAKINIDYDNSAQLQAFNKDPLHAKLTTPTVLSNWDALTFFTNAAELLLRSQDFEIITNDPQTPNQILGTDFAHFGVTNILIYSTANTNIHYNAAVHRLLQLAANIYDASGNNVMDTNTGIMFPSVFRPMFDMAVEAPNTPRAAGYHLARTATNVYITNFVFVTDSTFITNAFRSLSQIGTQRILPNDNVWGIPLVVGAKKGLPNFNKFAAATIFDIDRKLKFFKTDVSHTSPDRGFQMYEYSISNLFGVEAWNPYTVPFPQNVGLYVTNFGQVTFVNELGARTNTAYTNYINTTMAANTWQGCPRGAQDASTIKSNSFITVLTNIISLPPSQYVEQKTNFQNFPVDTDFQRLSSKYPLGYPVHDWRIQATNNVFYLLQDVNSRRIIDVVNLGDLTNSASINDALRDKVLPPRGNNWVTNFANGTLTSPMSSGVSNQIAVGEGLLSDPDWPVSTTVPSNLAQSQNFRAFMTSANKELSHECPFTPSATLIFRYRYEANDPLVHYTSDDLTPPLMTNEIVFLPPSPKRPANILSSELGFNQMNQAYGPWNRAGSSKDIVNNITFKDPMIMQPLHWQFPTNKFPSIGWLGRVHRGTPWQTFFLKAESSDDKTKANDHKQWVREWTTSITSYPTNDWRILDLFTVAPTENAARGLLSINQTNLGPWSALLSGIYMLTNGVSGQVLDPTNVPPLVTAINNLRATQDNGVFHHLGDFLGAYDLTRGFLQNNLKLSVSGESPAQANSNFNWDEVVERIPQEVLSLVKLGDPRFVIYAYGQSLKPANNSLVLGGQYRGMCTNYQITGEVVTRSVVSLSPDSSAANPKFVIESFNILPGN